jgi:hypothetical protein
MDKQNNVEKEGGVKHQWPTWWDGIDHPDVPFPKIRRVHGDDPGPEEILRQAIEQAKIIAAEPDAGNSGAT